MDYETPQFDRVMEYAAAADRDVIVTNSVSKTLAATGLRIGYTVIADESLRDRVRRRHMLTNVAVSRPAQFAVAHALETTSPDWFARNRQRVRDRIEQFIDGLESIGAEYVDPEGAFYVMARFDELDGSFDSAYRLIDEGGVAAMPGVAFGETRREWPRFSMLTPRIETACQRVQRLLGR